MGPGQTTSNGSGCLGAAMRRSRGSAPPFFRTLEEREGLSTSLSLHPLPNLDINGANLALREITRAMRQICLLQETGRNDEASSLGPMLLDPLIKTFRDAHGIGALPDDRLQNLLVCEQERVGNAAALGELLIPLLMERLRAAPEVIRPERSPASQSRPTGTPPRCPSAAPDIADLLDGMLAQEPARPAARARPLPSLIFAQPPSSIHQPSLIL